MSMAVRHHCDVPQTFPAITVGLSIFRRFLVRDWKTRQPIYLQMFRFWWCIFAVGFAIGVVAGIVIAGRPR